MAKKIGRNDPCPCGSGKKYKQCCLNKVEENHPLFGKIVSETFVLSNILKESKEFSTFYQKERANISTPVIWTHDLSLPIGINGKASSSSTGEKVIRLRTVPAALEDAFLVAEELTHIILHIEG